MREVVDANGERQFEVTFKKAKQSRSGIKCSDVQVIVDDWFWVSSDPSIACPAGSMHNLKDVPIYMKTSASGDMEASVWPMVLEKAYACFLAKLNADEGRYVVPSYGLLEPGERAVRPCSHAVGAYHGMILSPHRLWSASLII